MGTDITPMIETRASGGAWTLHSDVPDIDRSYLVFAALANVRNDSGIEPVSSCRGIPDDASPEFRKMEDWDASFSWLTLEETEEAHRRILAFRWPGETEGAERSMLEPIIALLRAARERGDEARFVFSFGS